MQRSTSARRSWLHRKLEQLETLAARATTEGERVAATRARGRVLQHLQDLQDIPPSGANWDVEAAEPHWQFRVPDEWSRRVLIAVLRSNDLQPYRRGGQRILTVCVQAPLGLLRMKVWPDYRDQAQALHLALATVANRFLETILQGQFRVPPGWKVSHLTPPRRVSAPRGPVRWI
jgi:hypothetical protein